MESHAGAAAGPAAAEGNRAAAGSGAAAAAPNGGLHTPGGMGLDSPMADADLMPGSFHSSGPRSGGRSSGRGGELGLSPAPGLTGKGFPGGTVARPSSAGATGAAGAAGELIGGLGMMCGAGRCLPFLLPACCPACLQNKLTYRCLPFPVCSGPSRFGQEAQHQQGQGQGRPPPQQPLQQQQQRGRPSGLIDDRSLWDHSEEGGQTAGVHPLGGDAGPMAVEQDEVSWDEEALPLSLPPPGAPASTLPPGAIM